ncbi:DNA cytosine methyltransferase [Streptomyces sp. MS19]|uniref:DNA cytosine methyltransferase n=1 Tax=Streptomyces sp. MS19 TaxID=3385972 RepID=UPI00399FF29A
MTTPPVDDAITLVDLFSGCGGFTEGFRTFRPAGTETDRPVFRPVLAVEKDRAAAETYRANFVPEGDEGHVHIGEIEHWHPTDAELSAEVVLGGPPCQGFSGLGKMDPADPRNKLWRHYVRVVSTVIRPKIFVIENVDRFLRSPEFDDLRSELRDGDLRDYELVEPPGSYLLNAADYGVPQVRRRAIVIGVRKDVLGSRRIAYPPRTHAAPGRGPRQDAPGLFDGAPAEPWRTVADVFARSRDVPLRDELPPTKTGFVLTTDLHVARRPWDLSLARYRAIPPGGNRKDLTGLFFKKDHRGEIRLSGDPDYARVRGEETYLSTKSWDNHNSGSGDVMGRLRDDRPSVTIRTEFYKPEKGRYLHPTDDRPITHFEAALIQGFPEDFRWCGSKTDIARQIGNAVPVGLGRAIAGVVHRALRG